jgi:hypothetical protein
VTTDPYQITAVEDKFELQLLHSTSSYDKTWFFGGVVPLSSRTFRPNRHSNTRIWSTWEYMFVKRETELQQSCNSSAKQNLLVPSLRTHTCRHTHTHTHTPTYTHMHPQTVNYTDTNTPTPTPTHTHTHTHTHTQTGCNPDSQLTVLHQEHTHTHTGVGGRDGQWLHIILIPLRLTPPSMSFGHIYIYQDIYIYKDIYMYTYMHIYNNNIYFNTYISRYTYLSTYT